MQFVHNLRAIDQIVEDIHPVVPNPYILLTTIWSIAPKLCTNQYSSVPGFWTNKIGVL